MHDRSQVVSATPGAVVRALAAGSLALLEGTWFGTATGQALPAIGGRYAAQWVRQNGRWLIRSEVFVALDCTGDACRWPIRLPR